MRRARCILKCCWHLEMLRSCRLGLSAPTVTCLLTPPAPCASLLTPLLAAPCRGVKDLNIPLLGSLAYLIGLVAFDVLLLFGPPAMGMEGAGYAASAAQWVGAATVVALLARKQVRGGWCGTVGWTSCRPTPAVLTPVHQPAWLRLQPTSWLAPSCAPANAQIFDPRDMGSLPGAADVAPYARMTAPLAVNNLSALLPTLVATRCGPCATLVSVGRSSMRASFMAWLAVCAAALLPIMKCPVFCAPHSIPPCSLATGLGVQHLGAHTILRQLMGFWLQVGGEGGRHA